MVSYTFGCLYLGRVSSKTLQSKSDVKCVRVSLAIADKDYRLIMVAQHGLQL